MGLTTLSSVKTQLALTTSTQDALLTQLIAQASAYLRESEFHGQYFGGVISANTLANPTVVTCIGHGLATGDGVWFSNTNSTPVLDGSVQGILTVTRKDDNTFTVPVNVTVAGTAGSFARQHLEFYQGNNRPYLVLRQRPVISIQNLWQDQGGFWGQPPSPATPFDSTKLLVQGTDYALKLDNSKGTMSKSGMVAKLNAFWPAMTSKTIGLLTVPYTPALGNIKVQYVAGYSSLPQDLQMLANTAVVILLTQATSGVALQSEGIEDYHYDRLSGTDGARQIASAARQMKRFREMVW
jgi:hypothetical protein